MRIVLALVVVGLLAAGCGRKGPLEPPPPALGDFPAPVGPAR